MFSDSDVLAATIELGRFSSPTSIKDGLTIRSDLFEEVEDVLAFIRKHINKSYIIKGDPSREERWQYPLSAIREIVINMIVHRDYMHYGDSSVKIYDDHIEFFNSGRLSEGISIAQLLSGNYVSQARNKRIAAVFKEAKLIEKYGSGIKRVQEEFKSYGLKAHLFEDIQHGFRVVIYAEEEKTSEKILSLIQKNKEITIEELAHMTGVSTRSVERNLSKLQRENKITRIGPDKGGSWKVNA